MSKPINVRWVIAHEPIGLFLRVADRFKAEIESHEATRGMFNFEIMGLSEYSQKYFKGQLKQTELLTLLDKGIIQMCHDYVSSLGHYSKDMQVLDLPFLFDDHAHADRVLEGEVGESLLESLSEKADFKGLAFTYSGGYRIIPSKSEINSVEGFKGMKVRTAQNPVAVETFKALGATPVIGDLEAMNEAGRTGEIDAGESTYIRVFPLNHHEVFDKIIDTKHSLFLTSIIASSKFFDSLSPEVQEILQTAAFNAAREERRESVADVAVTREECAKRDIPIIEFAPQEQAKLVEITQGVYKTFENYFTPGLVDRIISLR